MSFFLYCLKLQLL